ncbi:MAG: hypothetical protein U9O98_05665, partial [Asgard group archaeon]|nr:hypothetical protein [Asgard group archaeon]
GAFSVAHCQVKLAYILGHKKEIQETAQEANVHPEVLLKLAFLSGISFRSHKSRIKYEQLLGYPIPLTDPFQNVPFKTGLQQILQFIHRQKTKTIKINNLQDFKKIYQIYLSDENKRSNWVVILKPDLVIGVNKWGELIDAAKNMELLISEFLDWNVLTIELTTISYNELRALIKKLTNGKSIGSFLRTFRYIIVEGGRQSLYDPDSFESLSDSRFL